MIPKDLKTQNKTAGKRKRNKGSTKQPENNQQSGHSLSPYLPITTVNKNRLNSPIKTKEWLNGFFLKMIQQYAAAYKRLALVFEIFN